jgi:RNA polymerase-binding protein DksA
MAERTGGSKKVGVAKGTGQPDGKAQQPAATATAVKKATDARTAAGTVRATTAATSAGSDATPKTSRRSTAGRNNPAVEAPPTAAATAAEGAKMVKSAESKTASRTAAKPAARTGDRSAAETEKIRAALTARRDELQQEYDHTLTEIAELQRDRLTDSAGDDQADTGTKTFEREQEITLANTILERVNQVERALERLDEGSYGWCERCGNPIPVERLAAFPSATLCVSCKQLEERR